MIGICALGALFLVAVPSSAPPVYAAANSTASKPPETQVGLASFYSRRFDGKETASGEKFSNEEMVAAHRRLPLGSRVRVTNLENGESVEVRINDRGASAQNRKEGVIIDVSQAAATKLRMKKDGRVKVRVDVLEWGDQTK
jgi:rare lipoprotein A